MPERIVINTGPLLALARGDVLDIPPALGFEIVCPPEVRAELDGGERAGLLQIRPVWLRVHQLLRPLDVVARATLDDAEAAVIQLAVEQQIGRVCLDERKARQAALAAGLSVTGTLGLLLLAKRRGVLGSVRVVVEQIIRGGTWYDPKLVERILAAAGE